MSTDSVDDLEHAEDRMHSAGEKLRELINAHDRRGRFAAQSQARRAGIEFLEGLALYCRPTCGAEGADHDGEAFGGDDTCGCPCHDRWELVK